MLPSEPSYFWRNHFQVEVLMEVSVRTYQGPLTMSLSTCFEKSLYYGYAARFCAST